MPLVRRLALVVLLPACVGDLPSEGVDESAVLGGTNAPAGKWPDIAAVRARSEQFCSGTLIAPTVVLTAGHCNDPTLDNVLIGTSSLSRPSEGEVIKVVKRLEYESAPGKNDSQRTADLTVLVLEKPSMFAPRAIADGWARFEIKTGAMVNLVGYGAIDMDGNVFKPELQEATTTITDADCTHSSGCNTPVKPGGELGAGGMGIDTCGGDSGGPLYLPTDFGTFLAGATSRGYDNNQFYCSEGGIYVRPDKFVDWMETVAEVPVTHGPRPTIDLITAVGGHAVEASIAHNDPRSDSHTYKLKTEPGYALAAVRDDGRVRVCAIEGAVGGDSFVVTVTDTNDPTRTVDVTVNVKIEDGTGHCSPTMFGVGLDDGGGCCDSGRSAGGALPLSLGVLGIVLRRRRRKA
jgi:secreted trypsin-like serine protease